MKKSLSLLLACALLALAMPCALADGTTTLTTTVPASATYTLNIPADKTIAYGATDTDIGALTVSNASGFATGKDLEVTITYGDFTSEDVDTTIPMRLRGDYNHVAPSCIYIDSGDSLWFLGDSTGKVTSKPRSEDNYEVTNLSVIINSTDWGKALGGDYTNTITFSAKVVVEE